ncbi:MjaII restriction endonuclease [bacterium BMS3Bbin09]|nr:MjaII restriction endonuclease [bacterium BMS3Bbin09]
MDKKTNDKIANILQKCIDGVLKRVAKDKTHKPFHKALLTSELVSASTFERSFSTSFGQGPIEKISSIIAEATGAECVRQKETRVDIPKGAVDEIERITHSLRSGDSKPNWEKELDRVLAFTKGDYVQRRVLSDLWIKRDEIETFISIKTVKPNIDQTEIVKKDLLLLKAHDSNCETYLALYYNPGGSTRKDYNWSVPSKIFNMKSDNCVLIGKEYWDFLGGEGTYEELLDIFKEIGEKTRPQLKRLGH